MKKSNSFFVLGIIGLLITIAVHFLLYFTQNVSWSFMMGFYPVWIVFLVLGIGNKNVNSKIA
jgi:hypothetical protein